MGKRVQDEYASRSSPVQEDMHWQMKEWQLEKWGSRVLIALVILALFGAFSDGPLSQTTAVNKDGTLSVEYQRVMRAMTNETYTFRIKALTGEPTVLTLGRDFMDNFEIETLQPQPLVTHTSLHEMVLTWPASPNREQAMWLTAQPQSSGHFTSTITHKGAEPVTLSQWVLP
ncbi:hypothetical protein [Dryocola sp. BD626]|jgi:hypothetical protein|uniref:hypothetical protein n=1 Tax=Dryocola sp. BD626 TaxID=3133273 RepID=UPI003F50B6C8